MAEEQIQQPQKAILSNPNTGEVGYFPISDVQEAMQSGYQWATPEQIKGLAAKEFYGSQPVKAAALGAAEGLTAGLIDPVLVETGAVNKETIQGLHEYNPHITPISKAGGFAAGLIGPGLIGKALGGAPQAISGLGSLTEQGLAKGTAALGLEGTLARNMLSGAIQVGGRGVVEGATIGALDKIDENYLGNPEVNAQKLLAGVGSAALMSGEFGGGVGAIFGGAQPLIGAAFNKVADAKFNLSNMRNNALDKAKQEAIDKIPYEADRISTAYDNLKSPEGIEKTGEAIARAKSKFLPKQDASELYQQVKDLHGDINSQLHEMNIQKFDEFGGLMKKELDGINPSQAANTIQSYINQSVGRLEELAANPETYEPAVINEAKRQFKSLAKRAANPEFEPAEMFKEVHDTRRIMDDALKGYRNDPSFRVQNTLKEVGGMQSGIRDILKDSNVWGEAGARYGEINDALSQYYKFIPPGNTKTEFTKELMRLNANKEWEFNPVQIKKIITDPANPLIQKKVDLLNQFFDTVDPLSQQLNKVKSATGSADLLPQALQDLRNAVKIRTGEITKNYELSNFIKSLKTERPVESLSNQVIDGTLGNLQNMPGIGGAANFLKLDKVGKFLADTITAPPYQKFARNYAIQRLLFAVDDKLSGLAKKLAESAPSIRENASYLGQLSKPLVSKMIADQVTKPKDPDWKKRYDEIQHYLNNPSQFADAMSQNMGSIANHAPNTSQAIVTNLMNSLMYVNSKFPQNPNEDLDQFTKQKWQPSDADIARLERIWAGVFSPMSTFEDLSKGIPNREGLEAVQSQHPYLYAAFMKNIIDQASKGELPHDRRVHLSILFGKPLDVTMKPEFIQGVQQGVYGQNQGQQGPSPISPIMTGSSPRGLKNRKPSSHFHKLSQSTFSESDRLLARRNF